MPITDSYPTCERLRLDEVTYAFKLIQQMDLDGVLKRAVWVRFACMKCHRTIEEIEKQSKIELDYRWRHSVKFHRAPTAKEIEQNHNYYVGQMCKFKFLGYVPRDELGFQKIVSLKG